LQLKEIVYLGVLLMLALLSRWFLSTVESSLRENGVPDDDVPTLYVDNLFATRMNAQGILEYALRSPHLMQLPAQQGNRIQTPQLEVFKDGQTREWLIRAEQGWISPNKDVVRLENEVSIARPAAGGKPPVVITTRDLIVHPSEDYAETSAGVRVETSAGVVTAIGLKARLNEKQLELLSDVRGHYVSPAP
jgi:lipopolysaccharide export system protein LptC